MEVQDAYVPSYSDLAPLDRTQMSFCLHWIISSECYSVCKLNAVFSVYPR